MLILLALMTGASSVPPPPAFETPPSIFEWLEKALSIDAYRPFPDISILLTDSRDAPSSSPASPHEHIKKFIQTVMPRTAAISIYMAKLRQSPHSPAACVELMAECGIDSRMLDTMPETVTAIMQEAVIRCQESPPTTWDATLLELVGREDLNLLSKQSLERVQEQHHTLVLWSTRDIHTICHAAESPEAATDWPILERAMITRLIFSEDRRFIEAVKLVEPLRVPVAECVPNPSWSEAEVLEAQKEIVQWVMVRQFSLAPAQAMVWYDSKRPLITEKYAIHGFSTMCLMKPMNITVTAERAGYTEEKYGWSWFHAGVSAGLQISKHAAGIDTSWIMFNKPAELNNRHAGLLLGLGLNGHLKSIAKWLAFKYLTPKHTMSSIGLLLGLSAAYLGTMDTLVTRLLSVHITRMLPPGAAELNLSPLTQTTGLMGIGLLYYSSQHRRMSEVMLSEIEHVEQEDPSGAPDTLRDEGYRLAAGFALGLINLGKGGDLRGLHDMSLVERLLAVAVGTKQVNIVHVLDQATAGATIAIALIFMKTQNVAVARKIDIPDTLPQFDYVRPDVFLLRTLSKHLIMWDNIQADSRWIIQNLPPAYRVSYTLRDIKTLRSESMPFFNILAGLLWSISLKHAGTGSSIVRSFLLTYLDQFIRLAHLPAPRYDSRLTRTTVRNCQDLLALAVATVMAGTGDLDVFRRLRLLHGRVNPDTPYGSHLAAHMAIGVLFLGGGSYTLGTSDLAIAAMLCAFYPLFPVDVTDNKAHLQAFRHFWVLAAEPRCLIVRDVDTRRAISLPVILTMEAASGAGGGKAHDKETVTEKKLTAPCLLPSLDTIASIRTADPEFWQVTLDFAHNAAHLRAFKATQTIHVRRRPAQLAHSDVFSGALVALNDAQSVQTARQMWSWIFNLEAFRELDKADLSLVLPGDGSSSVYMDMRGTAVDERLLLRSWVKGGMSYARLWDLRCLFRWAEMVMERGDGRVRWLGREVLERLRAEVVERARRVSAVE